MWCLKEFSCFCNSSWSGRQEGERCLLPLRWLKGVGGGGLVIASTWPWRWLDVICIAARESGQGACRDVCRSFERAKSGSGTHHFWAHSIGQNSAGRAGKLQLLVSATAFFWGLYKCMRTENRIHAKLKLVELKWINVSLSVYKMKFHISFLSH